MSSRRRLLVVLGFSALALAGCAPSSAEGSGMQVSSTPDLVATAAPEDPPVSACFVWGRGPEVVAVDEALQSCEPEVDGRAGPVVDAALLMSEVGQAVTDRKIRDLHPDVAEIADRSAETSAAPSCTRGLRPRVHDGRRAPRQATPDGVGGPHR
ncbi:hypothetical protein [Actinoalloteichus fjordicus]|uniref:hypothetical protein n=1 Tax=Actinoalloteichus fjordicus TaxID=1612552 RepID=UPI0012FC1639|nr:hypothetical protein [Actinoalloteichus fjordicus]